MRTHKNHDNTYTHNKIQIKAMKQSDFNQNIDENEEKKDSEFWSQLFSIDDLEDF